MRQNDRHTSSSIQFNNNQTQQPINRHDLRSEIEQSYYLESVSRNEDSQLNKHKSFVNLQLRWIMIDVATI